MLFRAFESTMNCPECEKDETEAGRYFHYNLLLLSDDADSEPLEVLHTVDTGRFLLRKNSPGANDTIFKQRSSSIGLVSKDSEENSNSMKSISNESFIAKHMSRTGSKRLGSAHNKLSAHSSQ